MSRAEKIGVQMMLTGIYIRVVALSSSITGGSEDWVSWLALVLLITGGLVLSCSTPDERRG